MTRSKNEWMSILGNLNPSQQADRILADLIGYRKTSLKRAEDADTLVNVLDALQEIEHEKHDPAET